MHTMNEKTKTGYLKEWLDRVPAVVFGCLVPGELRIILLPGLGHVNGGAPLDVSVDLIPMELRMPNKPLWLRLDDEMNILRVWHREE
jgi:hypothetical protein